jgi:hypothetical protein
MLDAATSERPFLPLAESSDPAMPIDSSIKATDTGAIAKAVTKIGGAAL